MLNEHNLHNYQITAINHILNNRKCGLFVDMGMGKTVSTLTAIKTLMDHLVIVRVLIIAPLNVANNVWEPEVKKWQHLNNLVVKQCTGSAKERIEALQSEADIYLINRDVVAWFVYDYLGKQTNKFKWDMLIIDESSSFKNYKSQRFKALIKITKDFRRIVLLTGTPTPNTVEDIYSQIKLLDDGQRLGVSMTRFRERFMTLPYGAAKWEPKKDAINDVKNCIKDICISMQLQGNLQLKGNNKINVDIDFDDALGEDYAELQEDFILQLQNAETITATTGAAVQNKLLQYCNGCVYDEEGSSHIIHDLKIEALKELMGQHPDDNFLIAYIYKHDADRLLAEFTDAVLLDSKKGDIIKNWNDGKIKMLVAHPASAGHGLNLQKGGRICVWFGLTWSLELYEQFNARLHRQGQENSVITYHLLINNTIEYSVLDLLNRKYKNQLELLNHLKKTHDEHKKQ